MRTSIYLKDTQYALLLEELNRVKLNRTEGDKCPKLNDIMLTAIDYYFANTSIEALD